MSFHHHVLLRKYEWISLNMEDNGGNRVYNRDNEPVASIIVPVYNSKEYLRETVKSIESQSEKNLEIILIDDGSTDGSGKLCDEIKEMDLRIKVIHTENHGVAHARNLGIENAKAKYILPLDSDDLIDKEYVQEAVKILENDSDVGIVYCKAVKFGEYNGEWDLPLFSISNMLTHNCIFVTSMFRKDDWVRVGGFDEKMQYGIEDYDFWLSIIELGRKVYQIPKILFHYRIQKNSRSTLFDGNIEKNLDMYRYIQNKHKNLYMKYFEEFSLNLRKENAEQELKILKIYSKIPFYMFLKKHEKIRKFVKGLKLSH